MIKSVRHLIVNRLNRLQINEHRKNEENISKTYKSYLKDKTCGKDVIQHINRTDRMLYVCIREVYDPNL